MRRIKSGRRANPGVFNSFNLPPLTACIRLLLPSFPLSRVYLPMIPPASLPPNPPTPACCTWSEEMTVFETALPRTVGYPTSSTHTTSRTRWTSGLETNPPRRGSGPNTTCQHSNTGEEEQEQGGRRRKVSRMRRVVELRTTGYPSYSRG